MFLYKVGKFFGLNAGLLFAFCLPKIARGEQYPIVASHQRVFRLLDRDSRTRPEPASAAKIPA